MEGGSEAQNAGNGGPVGGLEGGSSSIEARLCKERRRRERRERRARRQQRNSLISQMDGCIYEQGGHHGVPDLLHHHLPPPAYTTLPGRGRPTTCPQRNMNPPQHSWRENLPGFARRCDICLTFFFNRTETVQTPNLVPFHTPHYGLPVLSLTPNTLLHRKRLLIDTVIMTVPSHCVACEDAYIEAYIY